MFFIPAKGNNYEKGFTFDLNGKIQFGTQTNEFPKVMILGCNHFCEDPAKVQGRLAANNNLYPNHNQSCTMHNGSLACGKLIYCKGYTQELIVNTKNGNWPKTSLAVFLKTLLKNDNTDKLDALCEYILFSNFFQRSMPYESEGKNKKFMTQQEIDEGVRTFVDIFNKHNPDILITWGNCVIGGLYKKENTILKPSGLSFRYSSARPKGRRINLPFPYPLSYDVLECPQKHHKCLVVESYHPSQHPGNRKYFNPTNIHAILVWAFQNFATLI